MTKNAKIKFYDYSIKNSHYKPSYKFYNLLNYYMEETFAIIHFNFSS